MVNGAVREAGSADTGGEDPTQRLILLGASNLARGIATVLQTARGIWQPPLDLMAALGHGRSYGRRSFVLGRTLPGIVQCGLWDDLQSRPPLPTAAIVTDVGNDILYGAENDQIIQWVTTCLDRLQPLKGTIVMTGLPLESLARLHPLEFAIFRSILYPLSRLEHDEAIVRAHRLHHDLQDLAAQKSATWIEPQSRWYGRDRIHIRRWRQAEAWRNVFAPLAPGRRPEPAAGKTSEFLYIRCLTPFQRTVFGITQKQRQPAGRLADGTCVSLY